MNRIDKKFRELRQKKKKAFISFIMSGDPSLADTKKLVLGLEKNGTDIVELGVPFSDPLADGPTIQRSSERALKKKVTLDSVFKLVKELRSKTNIPIAFLMYYNLIHYYGSERFVKKAVSSGVDGVIVPDLPPEESKELSMAAKRHGLAMIYLAAPTSSKERLVKISEASRGFIYYVSLTGTTGARKKLSKNTFDNLKKIKKLTRKPVCVGFGISTPEQVKKISRLADGAIVGSAIIKVIEKNIGKKNLIKTTMRFVKKLSSAI